ELVARVGPARARWLATFADAGAPHPDRRPAGPSRAAQARLLPDRWQIRVTFATAGIPDALATGALVNDPLPVGPDPRAGLDAIREVRAHLPAGSDGEELADALGLDTSELLRVDRADGTDLAAGRTLLRMLCHVARPALLDLLAPRVTGADVETAIGFTADWV